MACCGQVDGSVQDPAAASPVDFMAGPPEKIMYVTCLQPADPNDRNGRSDYLATVDVDPQSPTYCQVVNRLYMPEPGDELHHFGWNACVSCPDRESAHKYLIVPGFFSGNIHIVDVTSDPLNPKIIHFVKGSVIRGKYDVSYPHTVHCIPSGDVMIHTLGNAEGDAKGNFYLLDGKTFEPKGLWNSGKENIMGHDFWYQPRFNIMISTELGAPKKFSQGFAATDLALGYYGSKIHLWNWRERKLEESIDLGLVYGALAMEVRFFHNPNAPHAYVVTGVGSAIFHVTRNENMKWTANKVINVPNKIVTNWQLPFMPGLVTDQLISLDDKFLFFTCFLHGDVRQYDISNPAEPKLVSKFVVGGSTCPDTLVNVVKDEELEKQPERLVVKGRSIYGGPHMIQLSRDGKRLYVSTSIMTPWDKQFYTQLAQKGGVMLQLDVTPEGLKLNENFLVDFGKEPDGPCRGHEMRYPGGDCTSDVWI